jgi:hypothetical protein
MSDDAVNLGDLERQARVVMRKADIDYFDGGAEDELTLRNNVDDFLSCHPLATRDGTANPGLRSLRQPCIGRTAVRKSRIGRLGFGTGRQRMALERGTSPKLSRRTCSPRYGLHRVEGNRRASRNGRVSDLPPEIPNVTIRNWFIA